MAHQTQNMTQPDEFHFPADPHSRCVTIFHGRRTEPSKPKRKGLRRLLDVLLARMGLGPRTFRDKLQD